MTTGKEFEETVRCSKTVWEQYHHYPCSRKATVWRHDKPYCKQHDPVEVEKRKKVSAAKYASQSKLRMQKWAREAAALRAFYLLKDIAENGLTNDKLKLAKKIIKAGEPK